MLKLVKWPEPILVSRCCDTTHPTIDEAIESHSVMLKHNGIGISAPQVGLQKRFFWLKNELVVNPKILYADELIVSREGCLSIPGKIFKVVRWTTIEVEYESSLNKHHECPKIKRKFSGFDSIIFQHEIDHLEGILINELSLFHCLKEHYGD